MKFAVALAFAALFAVAIAAPVDQNTNVLRSDSDVGVDRYSFALETSDGTAKEETGELKNAGSENEAIAVRGSFSFVAPDGQTYTVNYIADENGFQPQGAHLPVAPVA